MPSADDITPAIFLKNEEYWIHYVLRDLMKVFGHVVLLDTGSTDNTIKVAKRTAWLCDAKLTLITTNCGNSPDCIGNSPNILRKAVKTEWMLLVGGDEIWVWDQLQSLLEQDMPDGSEVGMFTGRNLCEDADGVIMERDGFSADRLFDESVVWGKTDYPFEGHGLIEKVSEGKVHYYDGGKAYFWHVRYLDRSRHQAFMRHEKSKFFEWNGELRPVPDDWFGEPGPFYNPYVRRL